MRISFTRYTKVLLWLFSYFLTLLINVFVVCSFVPGFLGICWHRRIYKSQAGDERQEIRGQRSWCHLLPREHVCPRRIWWLVVFFSLVCFFPLPSLFSARLLWRLMGFFRRLWCNSELYNISWIHVHVWHTTTVMITCMIQKLVKIFFLSKSQGFAMWIKIWLWIPKMWLGIEWVLDLFPLYCHPYLLDCRTVHAALMSYIDRSIYILST